MKKICLESAKRKYTQQRHEGTYHSLWYRDNWKGKWLHYISKEGDSRFSFKELPSHRRKLAISMANRDNHQINDVSEGEQQLNLADDKARKAKASRKIVIRRRSPSK